VRALYIIPAPGALTPGRFAIVQEPCAAQNGEFHVRRKGRLVPAASVAPVPDAILTSTGRVLVGFASQFRTLADFARASGCNPDAKPLSIKALKKRPSAGRLALG
jgi:hypothetical protein